MYLSKLLSNSSRNRRQSKNKTRPNRHLKCKQRMSRSIPRRRRETERPSNRKRARPSPTRHPIQMIYLRPLRSPRVVTSMIKPINSQIKHYLMSMQKKRHLSKAFKNLWCKKTKSLLLKSKLRLRLRPEPSPKHKSRPRSKRQKIILLSKSVMVKPLTSKMPSEICAIMLKRRKSKRKP